MMSVRDTAACGHSPSGNVGPCKPGEEFSSNTVEYLKQEKDRTGPRLQKDCSGCTGEEQTSGRSKWDQGNCLRGYCRDECGLGQVLAGVTLEQTLKGDGMEQVTGCWGNGSSQKQDDE